MPVDREELRKLLAEATPGPWWHLGGASSVVWLRRKEEHYLRIAKCAESHDAALIVAVVNALPDLLAEPEAAEAERDRFKDDRNRLADWGERQRAGWAEGVKLVERAKLIQDGLEADLARLRAENERLRELEAAWQADDHDVTCAGYSKALPPPLSTGVYGDPPRCKACKRIDVAIAAARAARKDQK